MRVTNNKSLCYFGILHMNSTGVPVFVALRAKGVMTNDSSNYNSRPEEMCKVCHSRWYKCWYFHYICLWSTNSWRCVQDYIRSAFLSKEIDTRRCAINHFMFKPKRSPSYTWEYRSSSISSEWKVDWPVNKSAALLVWLCLFVKTWKLHYLFSPIFKPWVSCASSISCWPNVFLFTLFLIKYTT